MSSEEINKTEMAQDDIQCGGSTALSETITTVNLLIR
jgi:hypothetical protein